MGCAGVVMRLYGCSKTIPGRADRLDRQHRWPDASALHPGRVICTPVTWRRRRRSPGGRWHSSAGARNSRRAYALRLLGDIAARREPPASDQAGDYYRQALDLAKELGMRPLQAHCHRSFGTLYAATGV